MLTSLIYPTPKVISYFSKSSVFPISKRKVFFKTSGYFLLAIGIFFGVNLSYYSQELDKKETPKEVSNKEANVDLPSMNQAEIRSQRKWEVAGFGATGLMRAKINYNLNGRFSIGFTHVHEWENDWEPILSPFPGFASIGKKEYRYTTDVFMLQSRYYISEKVPFYITAGFGRSFIGATIKSTRYGYLYMDGSFRRSLIIEEQNFSPYNFVYVGLGFQWIFQNGIICGLEAARINAFNLTSRTHVTFLDPNFSLFGLLINSFDSGDEKKISQPFFIRDLWVGYSFNF